MRKTEELLLRVKAKHRKFVTKQNCTFFYLSPGTLRSGWRSWRELWTSSHRPGFTRRKTWRQFASAALATLKYFTTVFFEKKEQTLLKYKEKIWKKYYMDSEKLIGNFVKWLHWITPGREIWSGRKGSHPEVKQEQTLFKDLRWYWNIEKKNKKNNLKDLFKWNSDFHAKIMEEEWHSGSHPGEKSYLREEDPTPKWTYGDKVWLNKLEDRIPPQRESVVRDWLDIGYTIRFGPPTTTTTTTRAPGLSRTSCFAAGN